MKVIRNKYSDGFRIGVLTSHYIDVYFKTGQDDIRFISHSFIKANKNEELI